MSTRQRLRIALQKSGRLNDKSLGLLARCGLSFEMRKDVLLAPCENFPLDLMLVRDDDIPEYVHDGICDLGIVGQNVLQEKLLLKSPSASDGVKVLRKLGFGTCRLSLAVPKEFDYQSPSSLSGKRIATSYAGILKQYLDAQKITAEIIPLTGSVEIAPTVKIADFICDLVSSGETLRSNGLREVEVLLKSEAVLVRAVGALPASQEKSAARLLARIEGVIKASQNKYIMMNAPRNALETIKGILPGMESPSIIPLGDDGEKIAIHAVARENIFWETMERLKAAGASS
ncbi:MAG: ATP phosphoribosyltransferase, partial [Deltaproteobacteria bacterium]|nr:ATP phosphoribosyltransferase [Deltaproteobacteria bacterium]